MTIVKKFTLTELLTLFEKKGGKINKYYLQDWNRNKPAVVYLHGWFRGKNIKDALIRALT